MKRLSNVLSELNRAHPHRIEWVPRHEQALEKIAEMIRSELLNGLCYLERVPSTPARPLGHLVFDALGSPNGVTIGGEMDVPDVIYFTLQKWSSPWTGVRSGTQIRLQLTLIELAAPEWRDTVVDTLAKLLDPNQRA